MSRKRSVKPLFCSTICNGIKRCISDCDSKQAVSDKKEFDFTGKRFLLAEDNELNLEIAIEMLSTTGAQIDGVYDGKQCVEHFSQSPQGYYGLIFMDIQMPVMDGYTAAKTIRTLPREDAKTIPIWALTANAFVEDVEAAIAAGMNGHFFKPLELHLICSEISSLFT